MTNTNTRVGQDLVENTSNDGFREAIQALPDAHLIDQEQLLQRLIRLRNIRLSGAPRI